MKTKQTPSSMFSVRCWMFDLPLRTPSICHLPSSIFALLPLLLLVSASSALAQPVITPTTNLQNIAVFLGSNVTFSVTASGTAPLSYQWHRDGTPLADGTTSSLAIVAAQPTDEGDYTLVITNEAGAVTSAPARLWVVPPPTDMIRSDFTNASGQRLPYFYLMPSNYTSARSYPVICMFHGAGQDENLFTSPAGLRPYKFVFHSYRQQATTPAIILWPTRRAGGTDWTMEYLQLTGELLDALPNRFNIDTNRICVGGASQGVHAAWDMVGLRPSFFAAVFYGSGWRGSASATAIKNVPAWVCSATNDGLITTTRALVNGLRQAAGNPIYTEYVSSGHVDGITGTLYNPVFVDWFLSQCRGVASTNEPLLSIHSPALTAIYRTGATNLTLSGAAAALGQPVTQVTWTNLANNAKGVASGTSAWSATEIPLAANTTNLIIVVGTTTSWSLVFGGATTFSDSISVVQSPLRTTLALQGTDAVLNWTGGGPPYRVQRATDLAVGDWTDVLTDAQPPAALPTEGQTGFYRVVGQ